jgi:hypothetical protein
MTALTKAEIASYIAPLCLDVQLGFSTPAVEEAAMMRLNRSELLDALDRFTDPAYLVDLQADVDFMRDDIWKAEMEDKSGPCLSCGKPFGECRAFTPGYGASCEEPVQR